MTIFDYKLSTITKYREGSVSDPYVSISESRQIETDTNRVQLSEIPYEKNKVTISGYTEVTSIPSSGLLSSTFYVDYIEGLVYFASSEVGKTVVCIYTGRGNHFISYNRIYSSIDASGNITTLADAEGAITGFLYVGSYSSTATYSKFNLVSYQGGTFMALQSSSGNLPTNTTYWAKITGYQWRSTFLLTSTYNTGDYVINSSGDTIYQAIADGVTNIALTDTSKWIKIIDFSNITAAESLRASAENTRIANENQRVINETERITNEATRQSQETARQTNTATAITNTNTATINAQNAADLANGIANTTIKIYKPYVSTYADIATTYPSPLIGWTVQTIDTKIIYRYDGTVWIPIENKSGVDIVVGSTQPNDSTVLWIQTTDTNYITTFVVSDTSPTDTSIVWIDI